MKPFLQPEILREKVKNLKGKHKDYVVALPFMFLAISNLFATMPLTELKYIKVLFYKNGIITIPKKTKREKCGVLSRMDNELLRVPLSGDDEEILSYNPSNFLNFSPKPVGIKHEHRSINLCMKKYKKTKVFCVNAVDKYHAYRYKNLYGIKKDNTKGKSKSTIYKQLLHSPFFYETEIDWLEAALLFLKQGHIILSSLLFAKNLSFFYLDWNFNLKKVRDITTKEQKKGRLGTTFNVTREVMKLLKYIIDVHVAFRSGMIDQNKLCNTIYDVLANSGEHTAIYRYKYKIMKQIKKCKEIMKDDEQQNVLSIDSLLKVWLSFFRGHISLFYRYSLNLVNRILCKREFHPKTITFQRVESAQEIFIRDKLLCETNNKNVLSHLTEAWRSYKACLDYSTYNKELDALLHLYVSEKAKRYKYNTMSTRRKIQKNNISKAIQRKNIGRITRLCLRHEIDRQNAIMNSKINVNESILFYDLMKIIVKDIDVPFPTSVSNYQGNNQADNVAFSEKKNKKQDSHPSAHFFCKYKSLEAKIYDEAISTSKLSEEGLLSLAEVKNRILTQRTFKDIQFKLKDNIDHAFPVYEIDGCEQLVDSFLELWISYFFNKQENFFMKNVFLLKKYSFFCTFQIALKPIDFNLLQHILNLFMDRYIVEYIISRLNTAVVYKDIYFVNRVGVIKGFGFSFLIYELYYSLVDFLFQEEDIFYLRHDNDVIIARNTKMFSNEYINDVISRKGSLASIFTLKDCKFTEKCFTFYNLHVSQIIKLNSLISFKNKVKSINSFQSFLDIANRWNILLLSLVVTYREFLTEQDQKDVFDCEKYVLNLIKIHINSKMPARFPSVIFYGPVEFGGLGMYSIGNEAPSIMNYVKPWNKMLDENGELSEKIIDRNGLLCYKRTDVEGDIVKNVRIRDRYKKYSSGESAFTFFNKKLDGKLWSIGKYRSDIINFFGGFKCIMDRSVLSSIHVFYDSSSLWKTTTHSKMTKAQLSGAKIFPNRRFIFFWSPVINTSDVYVGYPTMIDKTGIIMHGKLASLKISYVKIFRDNLWFRICEGFLCKFAEINSCKKIPNDQKKWLNGIGADAIFENVTYCNNADFYDDITEKKHEIVKNRQFEVGNLWCDIQFRWGNFKTRDVCAYTKRRYLELKNDPLNFYPSKNGFVVGVDILYNTVSAFGFLPTNLRLPGLLSVDAYSVLKNRILKTLGLEGNAKFVDIKDLANSVLHYEEFTFDPRTGELRVDEQYNNSKKNAIEKYVDNCHHVSMDESEGIKSRCKIYFPALRQLLNTSSKMMLKRQKNVFNLYKNWRYSSYTNFCRLVLILNAFEVSSNLVLSLNDVFGYKEDNELIKMEYYLKNIIVDKYKTKRCIQRALTNSETRDVVFGKNIDIYKKLTVRTRNKLGDEIEKKVVTVATEIVVDEKWKNYFKNQSNMIRPIFINHLYELNLQLTHKEIRLPIFSNIHNGQGNTACALERVYVDSVNTRSFVNISQSWHMLKSHISACKTVIDSLNRCKPWPFVIAGINGAKTYVPSCLLTKLLDISSNGIPILAILLKSDFNAIYENSRYMADTTSKDYYFIALPPQSYRTGFLVIAKHLFISKDDIVAAILINGTRELMLSILEHYVLDLAITSNVVFISEPGYFLSPKQGYNFFFKKVDEEISYEYVLSAPSYFYDINNRFDV